MAERKSAAPKKKASAKPSATTPKPSREVESNQAAAAPVEVTDSALVLKDTPSESAEPANASPVAVTKSESDAKPMASPADQTQHDSKTTAAISARVLDVFLIDSGWNTPVCAAVHENVPAVSAYLRGHRFFVLNQDQSLKYIKVHPSLVGADPILLVVDRKSAKSAGGCGFRLCLGHVRQPEVAVSMLKWAMQLTLTASSLEMVNLIRKSAHRETLQGAIELIGEGSAHLLEFAPV